MGVMAENLENKSFCSNDEIFGYTKDDRTTKLRNTEGVEDCGPFINLEEVDRQLKECQKGGAKDMMSEGQDGVCMIELTKEVTDAESGETGLGYNVLKETAPDTCKKESVFFIQYACQFEEQVGHRQVYGLYFACTAVFIYFYATTFIEYIRSMEACNQVDYDVKTLTAGDYSVEFVIAHSQYESWAERYL